MPDLWDNNPDNVFSPHDEQPDPAPSGHDDYPNEVEFKTNGAACDSLRTS